MQKKSFIIFVFGYVIPSLKNNSRLSFLTLRSLAIGSNCANRNLQIYSRKEHK